jgi:hypothetical protein
MGTHKYSVVRRQDTDSPPCSLVVSEYFGSRTIGGNVRYGWGRDAPIPALRALPDFEITAVSTSRQVNSETCM